MEVHLGCDTWWELLASTGGGWEAFLIILQHVAKRRYPEPSSPVSVILR